MKNIMDMIYLAKAGFGHQRLQTLRHITVFILFLPYVQLNTYRLCLMRTLKSRVSW